MVLNMSCVSFWVWHYRKHYS